VLPARRAGPLAALAAAIAVATAGGAVASRNASFSVASTLAGKNVLPHRIHWLGKPSLPPAKIREVDFLIDGRRAWVEHHAPYTFAYDANYLVTSWMRAGLHTFTVVAVATDGRRASFSSRARTSTPKPPPAALVGSWHRRLSPAEAGAAGAPGTWTLTIDAAGWRMLDSTRHRGAWVDVAYLSPNTIEARGGIATRDHDLRENNPWCDEPFAPVRYNWRAGADRLTLVLAGPGRCDGQSRAWAGVWVQG
jgi:hypothetical protein